MKRCPSVVCARSGGNDARCEPRPRRPGYLLVELLAAVTILAILFGSLVYVVHTAGPALHRAALRQIDLSSRLSDAAEQFRADVASAMAIPEHSGDFHAGADTLILAPRGETAADRIVWHWRDGRLWRLLIDGSRTRYGVLADGARLTSVSFDVERPDGSTTAVMRLSRRSGPSRGVTRTIEIRAALSSDFGQSPAPGRTP